MSTKKYGVKFKWCTSNGDVWTEAAEGFLYPSPEIASHQAECEIALSKKTAIEISFAKYPFNFMHIDPPYLSDYIIEEVE